MKRRRENKVNRRERLVRNEASKIVSQMNRELIIDGYNLMHVTQFAPSTNKRTTLKGNREGLLSLLASRLHAPRVRKVTVVFDSENAPRDQPDEHSWQQLHVVFARHENSADDLIEKMIRQHAQPKRLLIVSSDHRVQVAAQRRRATWIDSDVWFQAILDSKGVPEPRSEKSGLNVVDKKLDGSKMSAADLEEFRAVMSQPIELDSPPDKNDQASMEFENPFPPGYFDDLA